MKIGGSRGYTMVVNFPAMYGCGSMINPDRFAGRYQQHVRSSMNPWERLVRTVVNPVENPSARVEGLASVLVSPNFYPTLAFVHNEENKGPVPQGRGEDWNQELEG